MAVWLSRTRRGRSAFPPGFWSRPSNEPLTGETHSEAGRLGAGHARSLANPSSNRVVRDSVLPAPEAASGPILGRRGPERVVRAQSQRQQSRRAEVQAAGRNVALAQVRLVAAETDRQPAIPVEGAGRF